MKSLPQPDAGISQGYVLVAGGHDETCYQLTAMLWEHGVPAYVATGKRAPQKTLAVHGTPALILLQVEQLDAAAVVDVEAFRVQYGVPLLCLAPAGARPPHVQALLQMATDFIVAPYQPAELLLRVRRICNRPQPVATAAPPPHSAATAKATRPPAVLTENEHAILTCLGKKLGEPVPLDELIALVPGDTYATRVRLLRVHIFRLRRKIEPNPKHPIYLRTVRDVGYYLSQQVDGMR